MRRASKDGVGRRAGFVASGTILLRQIFRHEPPGKPARAPDDNVEFSLVIGHEEGLAWNGVGWELKRCF